MELKVKDTLKVDPDRQHHRPVTNIMVRARFPDGSMKPADLYMLDRTSLRRWLMANARRMRNTVLVMLNHAPDQED